MADMVDKRIFSRYKVNFECTLVIDGDIRIYQADVLDISLTGMRIATTAPLEKGQTISFSFSSKPPVKGKARVAWVKKDNRQVSAGLEIFHLEDRFRDALQKIINELTLQHLTDAYCR